ncbi:RNA polymerase sigma factor [Parasphingopyxis marina]|uniref:RNA polymerase sigma factor n=1 Tax=Parasphingopyxis marina TaxID=2761622 RepID=A0A842HYS2_9SPHN|nr:RNA polymerase sigma factor [Parasphingopyxis marina]MBC2776644.1 RNA polymerase sigma factor [Parasphingopyxis marina]
MKQGLEAVYLAERDALLRFLRARGAGAGAEDLLQELWIRIDRAASGPIADPRSYLFRAANNLMLDRLRSSGRRQEREREWTRLSQDEEHGASDAPSAERRIASRQTLEAARDALDALGERTAAIFRRHRLDGIGQRQIAAEMGLSLSAVEKHLQKAYRAMIAFRRDLDADIE